MTDLAWTDAITQAGLIRDRQLTAVELTRAAIHRAVQTLVAWAAQLERARPWADRRPAVAVA